MYMLSATLCACCCRHKDKTRFVIILQSDLKGKLPTKVVETVIPSVQIHLITDLKKAISDNLAETVKTPSE